MIISAILDYSSCPLYTFVSTPLSYGFIDAKSKLHSGENKKAVKKQYILQLKTIGKYWWEIFRLGQHATIFFFFFLANNFQIFSEKSEVIRLIDGRTIATKLFGPRRTRTFYFGLVVASQWKSKSFHYFSQCNFVTCFSLWAFLFLTLLLRTYFS